MARTPKTIRVEGKIPLVVGDGLILAEDVEISRADDLPLTLEDGTVVGRVISIDRLSDGLLATFDVDVEVVLVRPEEVADDAR